MAAPRKPDWRAVGDAIVRRRAELGLTQEEVIERMETPINIDTLRKIEGGHRQPRLTTLAMISKALAWPHDALDRVSRRLPIEDESEPGRLDAIESRLNGLEAQVDRLLAHLEGGAPS